MFYSFQFKLLILNLFWFCFAIVPLILFLLLLFLYFLLILNGFRFGFALLLLLFMECLYFLLRIMKMQCQTQFKLKFRFQNKMDVNEIFFIGHNKYGQAGIGQDQHNKKFNQPKEIVFKTFIKQVSCGSHHSALLTIEGLIYTMGSNIHGTLGLGNALNINYAFKPTLLKQLRDVDQIFSGSYHMCALKQGGLYTWGKGIDGQLGHGNMKNLFVPNKVQALGNDVQTVSCGLNHTLVIVSKASTNFNGYSFGCGIYGQLGCGSSRSFNYPVSVKLPNIESVSAGQNYSLFISESKIYRCGDNSYFQLTDLQDSFKNKKNMAEPQKLQFFEKYDISLVHCHSLSAALTSENRAFAWGGKDKIWPPIQIEENQIINVKVSNDKIYYINSENHLVSLAFSNSQSFQQIKEVILSDKNILDFDAGQNHFLAIGDIIAEIQEKSEENVLSLWTGQSLASSKSTFSQKNILSPSKRSYFYEQNIQPKHRTSGFFITKHLKSGKSSQNLQQQEKQISQKPCLLQYDHSLPQLTSVYTQKTFHNTSSSIQVEHKNSVNINDSETKKNFEQKNFHKTKDSGAVSKKILQSGRFPFQNLTVNDTTGKQSETKLQKLMGQMELKTIHLKKNYPLQVTTEQKMASSRQKIKKITKTPSSYIKKEPEIFILQSEQNTNDDKRCLKDPMISSFQQNLRPDSALRQKNQANKNNMYIQKNQIKKQSKAKSVMYYKDKQNVSESENQGDCILNDFMQKTQKKSQKSIETIFRQLLRKNHRKKIQDQKNSINILSRNQLSTTNDRRKTLSNSCLSSKFTDTSISRLYKDSTETMQMRKYSELKISPNKQNKMAVSKISTHSNISAKSNLRKNPDLMQIYRSNRQLRYELRDRDLKISKLQQDLSRKQMEIEIMYRQMQQLNNNAQDCQKGICQSQF